MREIVGRAASSLGHRYYLWLGYSKLKPEQEQAILAFVSGKDVFVALPTGYGKSLCFGLLPRVFHLLRGVEKQSVVIVGLHKHSKTLLRPSQRYCSTILR